MKKYTEYILYCDESISTGAYCSDFFGGCILQENRRLRIEKELIDKCRELNINSEIKWTKVTENYLDKYCQIISLFFGYVQSGDIKIRIMFRKEIDHIERSKEDRYFKLYYQFIKHSFGFSSPKSMTGEYYVRLFLDELPDKGSRADEFIKYLSQLPKTQDMKQSGLHIRETDIGEVHSHKHIILQCVDIILGAMQYKLNHLDKVKPEGQRTRGKRTIAKEKLYKHILSEIRNIHPDFNVGVSTGFRGYEYPHWESPYEHWCFVPNELKNV